MLVIPPTKYRRARRPAEGVPPAVVGAALVLQYAAYDNDALTMLLGFDRQIDVSALGAAAITVRDGTFNFKVYTGASGTQTGMNEVLIALTAGGADTTGDYLLIATAGNGIVATDDGGTWPGLLNLQLPFGD